MVTVTTLSGAESADRYRLLIEAITDYAIYMLDPDGLVASWNPGAERFKGYAASDVLGSHFSRFYTDQDRTQKVPSEALATAAREGRFEAEGWRVRQDGTEFWAHVVIDPIRSPAGELLGFAKITRDLTERRIAEEALRQSQEQFRLLVESVTDYAIYMLDEAGHIVSWNPGAERIKGYARSEVIGRRFSCFYTPEDQAAGLPQMALTIAAREGRFEREGWRVRKDGTRFWAHVVIDVIRSEQGDIIGFAKVTRDITERMENQKALEQAREALQQAQKLEAIGQLTGGIAHDFNNLLAAVLGSLELVQKRLPYDPRISPLISNAVAGAQRGAVLTQRMLAFARKQDLQMQAVEVPSLARGMLEFLQRSIGPAIAVRLNFPQSLPLVRSDPNQLESALLNLLVNARDAMPGGGNVTISAEVRKVAGSGAQLPPGEYVALSVGDTGDGMDAATLARATEPFFTTKRVGRGTGLGLSMVHGLVAQSGGRLEIDSTLGEGTRITLWLPVAGPEPAAETRPEDEAPSVGDSLVILAVDDDPLVLTNTVALLEDLGHRVMAASSGAEAQSVLEAQPGVQILLTDEMMPGMTGSELARRALVARPGLKVIIASGFMDITAPPAEDVAAMRLAKPFTQGELCSLLSTVALKEVQTQSA